MTPDIRTIIIMLLITESLMAITLWLGIRGSSAPGLKRWTIGLGMHVGGWFLLSARQGLPDVVGIVLGDALLFAGLCYQLAALLEFAGRRVPLWPLRLAGPALFILILPIYQDYAVLSLVVSAACAAALVGQAIVVSRLGERGTRPVRAMLAAFAVAGAAALVVRAVDVAMNPDVHPEIFAASLLHVVAFLFLFAAAVTASFGFLAIQRERAESALRHMAMFDALTEVFNRRAFLELAERELARAKRSATPFALLMLDIDHFKQVNDRHGHQAGDRVLAEFAARVKACARASDLVGRYGGEEFCVLLPDSDAADAQAIAERMRLAVQASPMGGLPAAVTVSIGAAITSGADGAELDAVIGCADAALYAAKGGGRNRTVCVQMPQGAVTALRALPSRQASAA